MKIAITVRDESLNSIVPADLIHSNYLLIINTDIENQYDFIPNMYNKSVSGAEIFCSQFLIRKGIELFVCGHYNSQARDLLVLAGINTIEKPNYKIHDVLDLIKNEIVPKMEKSYEPSS